MKALGRTYEQILSRDPVRQEMTRRFWLELPRYDAHICPIVIALHETIRLMKEIDQVIDEHGGWPGAFLTDPKR